MSKVDWPLLRQTYNLYFLSSHIFVMSLIKHQMDARQAIPGKELAKVYILTLSPLFKSLGASAPFLCF